MLDCILAAVEKPGRQYVARLKILVNMPEGRAQIGKDRARELVDEYRSSWLERFSRPLHDLLPHSFGDCGKGNARDNVVGAIRAGLFQLPAYFFRRAVDHSQPFVRESSGQILNEFSIHL